MSADLVPFLTAGGTAADKVAVLARVAGLKDVLAERESVVREELEEQVRTLAELAGGQFTGRFEAGMAYVAGGNPKPVVSDRDALASWLADEEPKLVAWVERVEVLDHQALAGALQIIGESRPGDGTATLTGKDAEDLEQLLISSLKLVREPVWSNDLLDMLLADLEEKSGLHRYAIHDDVVVHTSTGQPLPGVSVTYSREGLTVKPDKKFREAVADELRAKLGALPAGGDA